MAIIKETITNDGKNREGWNPYVLLVGMGGNVN
jgi:hypothetical protein